MRNIASIFVLAAVLAELFMISPAGAVEIIEIGASAKQIGMGRAYSAMLGVGDAVLANPASISKVQTVEGTTMFVGMNNDAIYTVATGVVPTPMGILGIGFAKEISGEIIGTTLDAVTGRVKSTNTFNYDSSMLVVDYANTTSYMFINDLSYGFRLKYFSKGAPQISGGSVSGLGLDLGFIYPIGPLNLSLMMTNFMTKSYKWENGATEEADADMVMGVKYSLGGIDILADMVSKSSGGAATRFGAQWQFNKEITVRGGMDMSTYGAGESAGSMVFGFGYRIENISIDYAYSMDSNLKTNTMQFISLTFDFPALGEGNRRVEKLERQVSNMMEAWVGVAERKMQEGKKQDAMDIVTIVKAVLPDNEGAKDLLDKIEKAIGNSTPEAEKREKEQPKVRKVITEKAKLSIREGLANALNYFYLGEYALAIDECNKVLEIDPENVTALKRLGSIYYVRGDKRKALEYWSKAIKFEPNNKELQKFIDGIKKGQ